MYNYVLGDGCAVTIGPLSSSQALAKSPCFRFLHNSVRVLYVRVLQVFRAFAPLFTPPMINKLITALRDPKSTKGGDEDSDMDDDDEFQPITPEELKKMQEGMSFFVCPLVLLYRFMG